MRLGRLPCAVRGAFWAALRLDDPNGPAMNNPGHQDESGRLWDVLFLLRLAIGRGDGSRVVPFALHVRNDNRERTPPLACLKAIAGPDDGAPCITVMLPDED